MHAGYNRICIRHLRLSCVATRVGDEAENRRDPNWNERVPKNTSQLWRVLTVFRGLFTMRQREKKTTVIIVIIEQ